MARSGERKTQILQTLAQMLEGPAAERITTAALAAKLRAGDVLVQRGKQFVPINTRGQLTFAPGGDFPTFGNFVDRFSGTGAGAAAKVFGEGVETPNVTTLAFFVNDQWRVSPNLKLDIGARVDMAMLPDWTLPLSNQEMASLSSEGALPCGAGEALGAGQILNCGGAEHFEGLGVVAARGGVVLAIATGQAQVVERHHESQVIGLEPDAADAQRLGRVLLGPVEVAAFEFLRQAHEGASVLHQKLRSEVRGAVPLGAGPRGGGDGPGTGPGPRWRGFIRADCMQFKVCLRPASSTQGPVWQRPVGFMSSVRYAAWASAAVLRMRQTSAQSWPGWRGRNTRTWRASLPGALRVSRRASAKAQAWPSKPPSASLSA